MLTSLTSSQTSVHPRMCRYTDTEYSLRPEPLSNSVLVSSIDQ